MLTSPYSGQIRALVHEINEHFVEALELMTPYTRDDVIPGDRYGIINFRSFGVDRSSKARNTRSGFQPKVFQIDILLTIGCETWTEARSLAPSTMVDLDHAIPSLKALIETHGWVYDLETGGDIYQSMRQSISPPHFWMVDVTTNAIARMQVFKAATGEHIFPPESSVQLTQLQRVQLGQSL